LNEETTLGNLVTFIKNPDKMASANKNK